MTRVNGLLFVGLLSLVACAERGSPSYVQGLDEAERYAVERAGGAANAPEDMLDRALIVSGQVVSWAAIRDRLAEASGGVVVEEFALDLALERELRERGLTIGETEIEAERQSVLASIGGGTLRDPNRTVRLLAEVRSQRGLGPERFNALLKRNAMLRTLVAGEVNVTEAAVQQAYELLYGLRYELSIISVDDARTAGRLADRVRAGANFAELAGVHSTDVSGERGGRIGFISSADPAYPAGVREAARTLGVGEVSGPIMLEGGVVLVKLDSIDQRAAPSLETVRAEVEQNARLRQERVLMDSLARELIASIEVRFLDSSLRWSWEQRRERASDR